MHIIKKIFTANNFFIAAVAAFAASLIYLILLRLIPHMEENYNLITRTDYEFLPLFTFLGLLTMFWPVVIRKLAGYAVSGALLVLYTAFVVGGLLLGTVFDFYYLITHWDTLLHFISGIALGLLGFAIVDAIERKHNVKYNKVFIVMFAFCFAKALGALWEISEFFTDTLLGANTQRWADAYGEPFVGQAALFDTMKDMIANTLGAILVCVWGGLYLRKNSWPKFMAINKVR